MTRPAVKVWIRTVAFALLLAGSALALREFRRTHDAADLPSAAAKKGDFLVLVKCRGELSAQRSVQLVSPRDVPDLQIVWLAPPGSAVKSGQTVVKFDPSKSQQDLKEKNAALRQAQASLDQQVAQARNTAEQDKLDLAKAKYDVEKARLEASKQAIVSVIEGQESAIDLGLSEEKLKVQQAATALHEASDSAKMASLVRLRDEAKAQVDLTEKRLSLMELKSPIDGVINYLANYSGVDERPTLQNRRPCRARRSARRSSGSFHFADGKQSRRGGSRAHQFGRHGAGPRGCVSGECNHS